MVVIQEPFCVLGLGQSVQHELQNAKSRAPERANCSFITKEGITENDLKRFVFLRLTARMGIAVEERVRRPRRLSYLFVRRRGTHCNGNALCGGTLLWERFLSRAMRAAPSGSRPSAAKRTLSHMYRPEAFDRLHGLRLPPE